MASEFGRLQTTNLPSILNVGAHLPQSGAPQLGLARPVVRQLPPWFQAHLHTLKISGAVPLHGLWPALTAAPQARSRMGAITVFAALKGPGFSRAAGGGKCGRHWPLRDGFAPSCKPAW